MANLTNRLSKNFGDVLDEEFKDELTKVLAQHSRTRKSIVDGILEFNETQKIAAKFTKSTLNNAYREPPTHFLSNDQQTLIARYLETLGIVMPSMRIDRFTEARKALHGSYIVMYDLEDLPPPGHDEKLHARKVSLSRDVDDIATYSSLLRSNDTYGGRVYKGTCHLTYCDDPVSVIVTMTESERSQSLATFFLNKVPGIEELVLYGMVSSLNGDVTNEILAARVLAVPEVWFGKVPELITPQTIDDEAYETIASYLRHQPKNTDVFLAGPGINEGKGNRQQLSSIGRRLKVLLQKGPKKKPPNG